MHPGTGCKGDNDPLDVCEIGMVQLATGSVTPVKVLGVLAMIDDGETDWKIIAMSARDLWAAKINNIRDVERHLPGTLHAIREWFRLYKTADGKPENTFALDELFMDRSYAQQIIADCNGSWKTLMSGDAANGEASVAALTRDRRRSLLGDVAGQEPGP